MIAITRKYFASYTGPGMLLKLMDSGDYMEKNKIKDDIFLT